MQKMSLGEKIRHARYRTGLSQKEIAKKSGITVSFLSQVERDKAAPSLKSLKKIARTLGIEVNQVLHEGIPRPKRIKVIKENTNEKIILENGESLKFYLD